MGAAGEQSAAIASRVMRRQPSRRWRAELTAIDAPISSPSYGPSASSRRRGERAVRLDRQWLALMAEEGCKIAEHCLETGGKFSVRRLVPKPSKQRSWAMVRRSQSPKRRSRVRDKHDFGYELGERMFVRAHGAARQSGKGELAEISRRRHQGARHVAGGAHGILEISPPRRRRQRPHHHPADHRIASS